MTPPNMNSLASAVGPSAKMSNVRRTILLRASSPNSV